MWSKYRFLGIWILSLVLLSAVIDLNNLSDYEAQVVPAYIQRDNAFVDQPSNEKSTLGRILFYDKKLSLNNTIACASCHMQEFAFSDTAQTSLGFEGLKTDRHSMRLVNARFSEEEKFFWDERAANLLAQSTEPIKNAVEMGFSGTNGQPAFDSLVRKMQTFPYYRTLFKLVYGDTLITEGRIKQALSSFVRHLHSFDSKFDQGLAQTGNFNSPFPNYTASENNGKNLFLKPIGQGGANCNACHRAPEFDIAPDILNNGVVAVANDPTAQDLTNTRSPSLRDLFNQNGVLNGPLMHNGKFTNMMAVINHYNEIQGEAINPQLDPHLKNGPNQGQNLNLTQQQKLDLIAFLRTLSGNQIYTNSNYSNPFDANGDVVIIPSTAGLGEVFQNLIKVYPNPFMDELQLKLPNRKMEITCYDVTGKRILEQSIEGSQRIDTRLWKKGVYLIKVKDVTSGLSFQTKLIKN